MRSMREDRQSKGEGQRDMQFFPLALICLSLSLSKGREEKEAMFTRRLKASYRPALGFDLFLGGTEKQAREEIEWRDIERERREKREKNRDCRL